MSSSSGSAFGGANGLLEVYISRARDLPNLRKLDKQSPFVRLRVAHMIETSDVAFRGGQTPKFDFYSKFDLTPDVKPLLLVELFDDRSPPKLIGQCSIDLTPALYKDPEDGHDDWFQLRLGSEEAGQVYVELTFHPLIPTSRLQRSRADDTTGLEFALESRPAPPLPSKVPSFQLDNESYRKFSRSHDYSHASKLRESSTTSGLEENLLGQSSSLRNSIFNSSVASNDTFSSHLTTDSHQSHATVNTAGTSGSAGTTEPLFAKLKQLKEKWRSIKNPASDQTENENKVDLKALQKVVGVEPEEYHNDNFAATRSPSRIYAESKLVSQPPLPRLPADHSRRTSNESSPRADSRFSSSANEHSPRLPPLPSSPTFRPGMRSRNASNSPVRRRPPPLG
ncbi:LANO_0E12156g1_1 [Lachancea nothofagi CBS 11611]|uniref:LANO_0E12156g1_1 n=1 Tax=Lachancea nothofagi CBS 11611 TaxID=1266666 RepID=A0A1G4JXY6_9SACH|nr:LANO_0E12156g1_1 [Lachancea nothofagi CBS 11611]